MSYSFTTSTTFTRTHAKHLAAKVIADLYQCHLFYEHPTLDNIDDYQTELIEMLENEYLATYEFGFKRNDQRVLTWSYTVGPDGGLQGDSDAGGIYAKASVVGATYFNHLTYSRKWAALTAAQQASFKSGLPIQRSAGALPDDGNGYWQVDHGYGAGGIRVERRTFRPL